MAEPEANSGRRSTGHRRLETVIVERPRCPACGGTRLCKYRSIANQGDGSAVWWVRCHGCAHRFKVVLE